MTAGRSQLRSGRRGYTLVEMVLATTIISIVMAASVGAIALSAKAIPDGRSRQSGVVVESRALDQLAADLQFASAATLASTSDITATVGTRRPGAAAGVETVRYYWDQLAATKPLMRQVNGGTPAVVTDNVREFALVYDRRSVPAPQTYSAGNEQVLASNEPSSGFTTQSVTTANSPYQPIQPDISSSAAYWNVTRIVFKARQNGTATESLKVSLHATSGGAPTGAALETVTFAESSLPTTYGWVTATFTQPLNFARGQTVAVKFTNGSASGTAADIQYMSNSSGGLLGGLLGVVTGLLGGSSGEYLVGNVYGTVSTADPAAFNYYLTGVRATLRAGASPDARLYTSVRVYNEPQVTGP